MTEYTRILGDAVRKARCARGLTQNEVADRIEVDVRTVLNIENHKGNPKLDVLYPLVRTLEIDPMELFYPELKPEFEEATRFTRWLSQCDAEELKALFSICEAALRALRAHKNSQE